MDVRHGWWVVVAAAVALLVGGAFTLPRLLADEEPAPISTNTACVPRTDSPTSEIGVQQAT